MKILTLGDIHFGKRVDSKSLYEELKNTILVDIEKIKPNLIVLLGDLTDTKLQLNSQAVIYYNRFINELHDLALKYDFEIVAVNGTFSHERNQIKSFSYLFNQKLRYFDKPSVYIYMNRKFLILPEEYMRNKEEEKKLKELLNDKYDFVFGHGMFDHAGAAAIQSGSTKTRISWNWKTFENNVKFYVVFGHIHIGSKYKNIIYPGSFSREIFGEEEDKGYYYFEIDDKKDILIKAEKIINNYAPKYKYIFVEYLSEDLETMLKELRKYSEENNYIRVIINKEISENHYNNIVGFVKNRSNTSLSNKIPKKLAIKNNEEDKKIISEYVEKLNRYKGMDFIEITKSVAKDLYNEEFTTEEINEAIKEN